MRKKTIDILRDALKGGYAVGAFNTSNMEISQGIIWAAHELGKPCIIQLTPSSMDYAGAKTLVGMIRTIIENDSNSTQIGIHLDHGKSLDDVMKAIEAGVDSVMIDASQQSFKENLSITRKVVEYAHSKGVSVQAELGKVPYLGRESMEIDWESIMTDPEEAQKLVEIAEIDALAIGIGNAHGFFREKEEIDWERLKKIRQKIPQTPLIIHGASDWGKEKVEKAVELGVSCFNIDTDIRIAFSTVVCNEISPKCNISDPRKILAKAREAVKNKVKDKINLFNNK